MLDMAQFEPSRVWECVHLQQIARELRTCCGQQRTTPQCSPVASVCKRFEIHGKDSKASAVWTVSVQNMRLLSTQRDLTLFGVRAIARDHFNNFQEG